MFTRYTPENPLPHVLYARNEQGEDWYDFSRGLDKTTPKILVTQDGLVKSAGTDAEAFPFPENLSLVEVKALPTKPSLSWKYIDGEFQPFEDTQEYKDREKRREYEKIMTVSKGIVESLRIEKEYSKLTSAKSEQLKQAARDYVEAKSELEALNGTSK